MLVVEPPGSHRPCDTLEVLCCKVLKFEQTTDEPPGAFGNHDAVRLRNALQTSRKVRRLANDCLLLRSARADQITYDHKPCGDAYARLQGRVGLQIAYRGDQLSPARTARSASSSCAWG